MQLPRPHALRWRTAGLTSGTRVRRLAAAGAPRRILRATMASRQNRLRVLILLAAVALAVSSALGAEAASAPSAATVAVPRLVWHRCASREQQGFQCATARVPLDYINPRGPKIHL